MNIKLEKYRRYIFIGIIIIALGVTLANTMKENTGSLGIVFIGVGGLFLIIDMNLKRKEDNSKPNT